LGSLSNLALLVNNLFDVAQYAGSRVVSAVSAKPPHDGRSRVCAVAVIYFSPRLLCRFDLAISANSTSWRIASEREGLSGCCFAQVSIADLSAGESRIAETGSLPVAGRPRFLFGSTFFVDMVSIFW
jgi:hypothetical protein